MRDNLTKTALANLAREIVQELAGSYLRDRATQHVELYRLFSRFRVVECGPAAMEIDGCLARRKNGFAIRYAIDSMPMRRRFTVAHELAHIMLAEWEGTDLDNSQRSNGRRCPEELAEELLVDMIAAELLMPTPDVLRCISRAESGWAPVQRIRYGFSVSLTASIRRMLHLPKILCIWTRGNERSVEQFAIRKSECIKCISMNDHELWLKLCVDWRESAIREIAVHASGMDYFVECQQRMMSKANVKDKRWSFGWRFITDTPVYGFKSKAHRLR